MVYEKCYRTFRWTKTTFKFGINYDNAASVSYTHLDVYKRQVHNGRVYYGTGVLNGGGKMIIADATTLKTIYEVPLKGYPQASPLLSTAYEKSEGKVYVYVTYNELPGGIAVIEDAPGQTEAKVSELFDVPSDIQQYCIASPICDSNGTIYYKNDSSHIIAIENTKKSEDVNITFDADNGQEAVVKTVSEDEALDYTPEAPTKDGYVFVGWYKDVDNIKTEYKSGQKYTENTTYKAKYAHVQMIGAQARTIAVSYTHLDGSIVKYL